MFLEPLGSANLAAMAELAHSTPPAALPVSAIAGSGLTRSLPALTAETANPSVWEIVELIGEAAAETLCDRFGGIACQFSVLSDEIAAAIGAEATAKLRKHWGEERCYIPRRTLSTKARHALIRQLALEGMKRQAIALRMRMSERHVYRILGDAVAAMIVGAVTIEQFLSDFSLLA